jgi:ABC-type sugar transport system ATPase subunit
MTVRQNIGFPLKMAKTSRDTIDAAVEEVAEIVALADLLERPVSKLSGGQRQRVALARALVRQPRVTLMDEPLSNLDALLRVQTREELLRLHRRVPGTVIYVTHDQVEALTMGDRIGVMRSGELVQVGSADEVYARPANRFVAGFVGSPRMNLLDGKVETSDGHREFVSGNVKFELPGSFPGKADESCAALGVRPEALSLGDPDSSPTRGVIRLIETTGADRYLFIEVAGSELCVRVNGDAPMREGEPVGLRIAGAVHMFDASGERLDIPFGRTDPQ